MNVNCTICPKTLEDQEHIFRFCHGAKGIWDYVYPTIKEILKPKQFKIPDLIANNFPDNISHNKKLMVTTIIQIALHRIWLNRNHILYDKMNYKTAITQGRQNIKYTFTTLITKLFDEHTPNNIVRFSHTFCHTPTVCTIRRDTLSINLVHDHKSQLPP